jgi:diaminohydroxyphosphoribosylaminopyrimidine deaminase/5-amino-6-(5-phosphoribosylamino)uracil reductase
MSMTERIRLKSHNDLAEMPSQVVARSDPLAPLIDATPGMPFVIAQLGQSLDGRIATPSGHSRWINSGCALDHLHRLRANVDAVLVGASTVLADDPALTVRRVAGKHPARIVIDPRRRVPQSAKIFAADGIPAYVISSQERAPSPTVQTISLPSEPEGLSPREIVKALSLMGFNKILVEGGANTVSRFINAGVVNRLHLLIAPIILGSGVTGLSLNPVNALDEACRPPTRVHVLDDGDVLFDCALV